MLSVNPIARVVVNAVRSSASPASFDTGLLLIKDTNYADSRRLATVNDSAAAVDQLTTWGFASSSGLLSGNRRQMSGCWHWRNLSPGWTGR